MKTFHAGIATGSATGVDVGPRREVGTSPKGLEGGARAAWWACLLLLALVVSTGCGSSAPGYDYGTGASAPSAAAPTQLRFVTPPPAEPQARTVLAPIQVAVLDQFGNTVKSATNQVTIGLLPPAAKGRALRPRETPHLLGTTTMTPQDGIATFSDLQVSLAGTGYRWVATSPGLTTSTSDTEVTISPLALAYGGRVDYDSLVQGTCTSVADFDGDGKPDVVTAGSDGSARNRARGRALDARLPVTPNPGRAEETARYSVLLGKGDLTLGAARVTALSHSPSALVTGDFNRDGKADFVLAYRDFASLAVYLGAGDGTFAPPAEVAVAAAGSGLATADFNRDGRTDLAVIADGDRTTVLLGQGDGTFSAPHDVCGGGTSVAAADFNGDGNPDLAGISTSTVLVSLGRGDGTFQDAVGFVVPDGNRVIAADLNGDGKTDLVTNQAGGPTMKTKTRAPGELTCAVRVSFGNGDGTFQAGPDLPLPGTATAMAPVDLDRDGRIDLVVCYPEDHEGLPQGVLLGKGDGTFGTVVDVPGGPGPSLVLADMDLDGFADLLTGNGSATVSVSRGKGNGTFATAPTTAVEAEAWGLKQGDLDGDGRVDLVTTSLQGFVQVLMGRGDGAWQPARTIDAGRQVYQVEVADVNKDGKPDLIFAVTQGGGPVVRDATGVVSVLLGKGDGTFLDYRDVPAGCDSPHGLAVADFNRDGNPDFAVAGFGGVYVHLGNGDGTFRAPAEAMTGACRTVLSGDVDGDGKVDLLATATEEDPLVPSILKGNGDGTFGPPAPIAGVWNAQDGTLADVDGDGRADVALAVEGRACWVGLSQADGSFKGTFYQLGTYPMNVFVTDVDADDKMDLIIAGTYGYSADILLGKGDGTFPTAVTHLGAGAGPIGIVAGDFNGDGKPDIATADYFSGTISTLLHQ